MSSDTAEIYSALAFRKPKKYTSKSPTKKQQSFMQSLEDSK